MTRPRIDGKLAELEAALRRGPLTIERVQEITGTCPRVAYRWISRLEDAGADVVRRRLPYRRVSYQILGGN